MATTILDTFITIFSFKTDRRGLEQTRRNVRAAQSALDGMSTRLAVFGAAGAAAIGVVGRAGLETDAALRSLEAVTGATLDEIKKFKDQAFELGNVLPLDTSDIVDAQREYAQLGASIEETLRDIPAVAEAAIATNVPIAEVARIARTAYNTYGGAVEHLLDVTVLAGQTTPATFSKIGEAFGYSAASAETAGLSYETLIATLGVTAGSGRDVTAVSQGLNQVFINLARATGDVGRGAGMVQDALSEIGFTAQDVVDIFTASESEGLGWVNFLKAIRESDPDPDKLTAFWAALGGSGAASALQFAIDNVDALDETISALENSTGSTTRSVQIMMSGVSGSVASARAAFDTFLNRLFDAGIGQEIEKWSNSLNRFLNDLTAVDEQGRLVNEGMLRFISTILKSVAALTLIAIALRFASFTLGTFSFLMTFWRTHLIGTRIALAALALQQYATAAATAVMSGAFWAGLIPALGAATAAAWAFTVAMLLNPITWIVLAIIALIAAIALLIIHWDTVREAAVKAWDWILDKVRGVFDWVRQNWPLLLGILLGPFGLAAGAILKWRENIIGIIRGLIDWVIDALTGLWDWTTGILDNVKNAIGDAFSAINPFDNDAGGQQTGAPAGLPSFDLSALAIPPSQPFAIAGASTSSSVSTTNVSLERIDVNVERGDPDEIAAHIGRALHEQLQTTAEDLSSPILR